MNIVLILIDIAVLLFGISMFVKDNALYKDIQLNSHRISSLEAELKEAKERLLKDEMELAELAQEAGMVQDLKEYNEGISNIMSYNVDVAMGKNK